MNIKKHISTIRTELKSARGKKLLQFLLFTFIAFIFWFALTLNEEFRYDVEYSLSLKDVPDSVTVISNVPNTIKTNITSKGYQFLKNSLKSNKNIEINFSQFKTINSLKLGQPELSELIRTSFGLNSHINSISLDSINIYYTNKPGKIVSLKVNAIPSTNSLYVIAGEISTDAKSIALYSINEIPNSVTSVETEKIICNDLTKTTTIKAKVLTPKGIRAIPDSVNITIPVEPLLSKKKHINIEVINCPEGKRLIPFPSQVEVGYLIPKSLFNNETKFLTVVVNYDDIAVHPNKLPVHVIDIPEYYQGIYCSVDSVEYIIEQ